MVKLPSSLSFHLRSFYYHICDKRAAVLFPTHAHASFCDKYGNTTINNLYSRIARNLPLIKCNQTFSCNEILLLPPHTVMIAFLALIMKIDYSENYYWELPFPFSRRSIITYCLVSLTLLPSRQIEIAVECATCE